MIPQIGTKMNGQHILKMNSEEGDILDQERDMFYGGGYGMPMTPGGVGGPMAPGSMMPGMMQGMEPGMNPGMMNPGMMPNMGYGDIDSRLIKLEQQIKRLDFRVSRLETPYGSGPGNKINMHNEPDSSMYVL